METNKDTIWITIPEETVPAKCLPKEEVQENPDKVKNRAFWGAGFIALIMFTGMLLAPQQFANLMQAQLFDGGFQVVPDYEDQSGGAFFEGDEEGVESEDSEGAGEEEDVEPENETVVDADDEAVSIQIEPLADTDAEVSDEQTGDSDTESQETASEEAEETSEEASDDASDEAPEETPSDEAVEIEIDSLSEEDLAAVEESVEEALGAALGALGDITDTFGDIDTDADASAGDSDLPAGVQAELDALKALQEENQALIAQLTQLLQGQGGALHGAATTISPSLAPQGVTQPGVTVAGTVPGVPTSVYRYNTHTVTVSPYDVLANNQAAQAQVAQAQQAYQASVAYGGAIPYDNSTYNPVLAGVQGQPGTGPAESMLLALLLASVGVLTWGAFRAARA